MNNTTKPKATCIRRLLLIGALTGAIGGLMTCAGIQAGPKAYTWYDGDKAKTVYLQPELLADFSGGTELTRADSGARQVHAAGKLRIYRVTDANLIGSANLSRATRNSLSPVFRDGDSAGSLRALPGNIVVMLKPGVSAQAFARAHGLALERHLFGSAYVFQTGPGLESLNRANALRKASGVQWAMPNWWVESHPR